MRRRNLLIGAAILVSGLLASGALSAAPPEDQPQAMEVSVYDEAAYNEYVEQTMQKLDKLYLDFCATCGTDATKARMAKEEFLVTVRDLMQHMNARFDRLDPKQGDALSPTDTLVSVHALTMLVDILTATQIEQMAAHPYVE